MSKVHTARLTTTSEMAETFISKPCIGTKR
jgi:hypothetical protein